MGGTRRNAGGSLTGPCEKGSTQGLFTSVRVGGPDTAERTLGPDRRAGGEKREQPLAEGAAACAPVSRDVGNKPPAPLRPLLQDPVLLPVWLNPRGAGGQGSPQTRFV